MGSAIAVCAEVRHQPAAIQMIDHQPEHQRQLAQKPALSHKGPSTMVHYVNNIDIDRVRALGRRQGLLDYMVRSVKGKNTIIYVNDN